MLGIILVIVDKLLGGGADNLWSFSHYVGEWL